MKIVLVGAGQVGATIVEALHGDHEVTVIDLDTARLQALSYRFDVRTVKGNGATRRVLQEAGVAACRPHDRLHVPGRDQPRRRDAGEEASREAQTIVRTSNPEYLEAWQERQIDVDFMVSSELETAHAVSRTIGVPAAKQTDVFAEGQVQIVEFDVPREGRCRGSGGDPAHRGRRARPRADRCRGAYEEVVGQPLREATIPADSKVASIIRGERVLVPRGDESIKPGDRIIVIGSPDAAREWGRIMARGERRVDDVVIFGGGATGLAIARVLLDQRIRVRLIEPREERAREIAEELPDARVYCATGLDPDFIERERIGQAAPPSSPCARTRRTSTRRHSRGCTASASRSASSTSPISVEVFEHAGIDVAVNPRSVTAEEIVRFAHDPRIRQLAMLEGDRFEVLDITVRETSKLVRRPFKELPMTGSLIGAIVRDGSAIFPHGGDQLEPGDRAIIFTESSRVAEVEKAL